MEKNFQLFKTKGFTLIELLVVLAIITILITAGLISYREFAKSGRDAKRHSDLRGIQSALEQFHLDHIYYPSISSCSSGQGTFATNCVFKSTDGSKLYLNKIPSDSLSNNPDYCYIPSGCDSSTPPKCVGQYRLYAKLEKPPEGSSTYNACGREYNFEIGPP